MSSPFVKWAGGKRQILERLRSYVPPSFGTYIEPFIGGGAMFFDLHPERAIIADTNLLLIKAYWSIRNSPKKLIIELKSYEERFFASKDREAFYYKQREEDPLKMTQVSAAAWLLFMNRTCFNGLFRVNKSGRFNVPYGDYKNPKILDEENIHACSKGLQRAEVLHSDFRKVLKDHPQSNDFVYLDPPYIPVSKTASFTAYTNDGFGPSDQRDLAAMAAVMKLNGVHVLASGSGTRETEKLYRDAFTLTPVAARRNINSDAGGRDEIKEFIIHSGGP